MANLKPRQMKFGLSEGMILAAGGPGRAAARIVWATFDADDSPKPGDKVSFEPATLTVAPSACADPETRWRLTRVLVWATISSLAGCNAASDDDPGFAFGRIGRGAAVERARSPLYDDHRRIIDRQSIATTRFPGTLLLDGLPAVSQKLRVIVQGRHPVELEAARSRAPRIIKGDGRGAAHHQHRRQRRRRHPDALDNCPNTPNPDQADANGERSGRRLRQRRWGRGRSVGGRSGGRRSGDEAA